MKTPPITVIIAEGLDATRNGKGFTSAHEHAFRLANAAPALLTALKALLLEYHQHIPEDCECPQVRLVADAARAAIAAAEGKKNV